MSGSSAIASARRRRAAANEPVSVNNRNEVQQERQQVSLNVEEQKVTPLELLKIHDSKISFLEEKLNSLDKLDNINNLIEEKLNEGLKNLNNKDEKMDEEFILNKTSIKVEELVSNKLMSVNDTIKSILINIEKLGELSNLNDSYMKKIEDLINEINSLKILLIKNQTLALETAGDIIKMKDKQQLVDISINNLETNIANNSSVSNNSEEDMYSINLLQKLMTSQLGNSFLNNENNNNDSDVDSESEESDNNDENIFNGDLIIENINSDINSKVDCCELIEEIKEIKDDMLNKKTSNNESKLEEENLETLE